MKHAYLIIVHNDFEILEDLLGMLDDANNDFYIHIVKMTDRSYEYVKGLNGHFEMALYVDTFVEVDKEFENAVNKGATAVLKPTTEPSGQRTCFIADPEGNLIEIG